MATSTPASRPSRIALVAVVGLLVAACGVTVRDDATRAVGTDETGLGVPIDEPTTTSEPGRQRRDPVELEVTGLIDSPANLAATTAIADLEEWWADEFPRVFGEPYAELSGGLFAYDSDTEPTSLPCMADVDDIRLMIPNAFYCPPADAIAWDQEELLPTFHDDHGTFAVAVVLAHEWGHVIQAGKRADFRASPIVLDLQADCYAGAWARRAHDDDRPRFEVDAEALDGALTALLELRDAPGTSPTDEGAHGSGFDRVSAFQDGYVSGASSCADYDDGSLDIHQFPFSGADLESGGDLPLEQIKEQAGESLEAYWTDVFPDLAGGERWPGLDVREFREDDPPDCNGRAITGYRLFLCWPDRYVGLSTEAAAEAYRTGIGGDFAVAALIGTQYGLGVQLALGDDPTADAVLGTLRGDCLAGAWGAALIPTGAAPVPQEWLLTLSPGDLDEGIGVLLAFRTESDRARQGPGFDRVAAFRTGVVDGPRACLTYERGDDS